MKRAKKHEEGKYGENLTGYAVPAVEPVPNVLGGFRRRWVLRVSEKLPHADVLRDRAAEFALGAKQKFMAVYGENYGGLDGLPAVSAVRLGDHHLVLEIDCHKPESGKGDEAVISTTHALQEADRCWCIEDLEGIPRRFWFILGDRASQIQSHVD